jgi:predicted membrane channel-forming protein YqfA (hemolysin III family)
MSELLQWIGAILCLIAFALSQRRIWNLSSYRYLIFNLIGGTALSVAAVLSHQWGFVLLEGVWAMVAAWGISMRLRQRPVRDPVV